ncbi:MAG: hypothetical protein VST68_00040 [Nitrospirota bacterium]|nr:hypothetical protein [Nitrospirota bacterium]
MLKKAASGVRAHILMSTFRASMAAEFPVEKGVLAPLGLGGCQTGLF